MPSIDRRVRLLVLAAVIVAVVLLVLFAWSHRASTPVRQGAVQSAASSTPVESAPSPKAAPTTALAVAPTAGTPATKSVSTPQGTATLIVGTSRYALTDPEGSTLKVALDTLQAHGGFAYRYQDYAGLGAFVTEINNSAGTNDHYWILYVNGKKSPTGVSATHIHSGDVIEWKLESSY